MSHFLTKSHNRESSEAAPNGSKPTTSGSTGMSGQGQDYAPVILTSTGELGTNRKQRCAESESSQSSILVHEEGTARDAERAPQISGPQPIVALLDLSPEDDEPDWDELTARAAKMCAAPGVESCMDVVERVLGEMGS